MMRHISICITIVFLAVFSDSMCAEDEQAIYCYGELDYRPHNDWYFNTDGCGGVTGLSGEVLPFWREFVVPRAGPFEVWIDQSYDPCEAEILDKLEDDYGGFAGPSVFARATDGQMADSERHVEALCIAFYEYERFIRGLQDKAAEPGLFDDLVKLSELKHLELYQFDMDSETFAQIGELDQLEYLGLPHSTTDEAFQYVQRLKKLEHLNASNTSVKGTTLDVIADMPELHILDLRRNELAPGVLASLRGSTLETLLLSDTNVTDEDVKYLIDLPKLRNVGLHRTAISDESLAHLSRCRHLRHVSLYDTKTTESGRRQLMQARSELVLDAQRPPTLCEFIRGRHYVHALLGNDHAQLFSCQREAFRIRGPPRCPEMVYDSRCQEGL